MRKLVFILMLFTGIANAQIVTIPDANFKARLLAANISIAIAKDGSGNNIKIDVNDDGEIQQAEADLVWYLEISYSNISDLTGIASFINLRTLNCSQNAIAVLDISGVSNLSILNCSGNALTNLDISSNLNLTQLNCGNNSLTALNVSNNLNLTVIECSGNNLNSLIVTANINLTSLNCSFNNITSLNLNNNLNLTQLRYTNNNANSLNISNNINLIELYCKENNLNSLNLTNNPNLTTLWCSSNNLTSLNLYYNPNLSIIRCEYNNLNSLNVANNPNLTFLWCYNNNLNSLDVSHNPLMNSLDIRDNNLVTLNLKNGANEPVSMQNNPNLTFICVDDVQLSAIQNQLNSLGMTATVCNAYCSFIPGGNYNTITGTMTFDANNDGCDVSDLPKSNVRVNINDGTNSGASFTNSNGNYAFYTQAGNFTITPSIENPSWFTFSPPTAVIPFANNNNNVTTQNFCVTANGIHPDVEVVIAPIGSARPGFDAQYKVVYKNKGNQTISGNVTLSYDDAVLSFVSSTVAPSLQSTGLLTYDYTNLLPFENRSFYITLHVNAPTDSPAVNIGDQLSFTAMVNPVVGDGTPSDNTFQFNQAVVGSFDPNDITCIEGNVVPPAEIGNYLHYVINFENTGTADAENIVVRDAIDATQFDVNSLQVLNSSDPVTAKLTNNVAEFIFPNINLHSGGHGNILIKIKSKNSLVQGNTVSKRANIYFDYNAPIDTNLENTTFQLLSNSDFDLDNSISIYPNPTKGNINISCNNSIRSIQLYDVQGRLLQTSLVNENQTILDISSQSNGVYFVKVISDKGVLVQKIIKE